MSDSDFHLIGLLSQAVSVKVEVLVDIVLTQII